MSFYVPSEVPLAWIMIPFLFGVIFTLVAQEVFKFLRDSTKQEGKQ